MKSTRTWSNLLIWVGAAILLLAGGGMIWRLLSGRNAPVPLPPLPTVTETVVVVALPTWTEVAPAPTETLTSSPTATALALPTDTPTHTPKGSIAVATPQPSAKATPTSSASPTLTVTATPSLIPPSATPTPSASATLGPRATPGLPRIEIAAIGVNAAIGEVSWQVVQMDEGTVAVWDTPAPNEAAHHRGSASPGEKGNMVLAGHGSDDGIFARLEELEEADLIVVYADSGQAFRYRVTETAVLQEVGAPLNDRLANAAYMDPTDDARLTLVTCWPAWAYTHRLIVVARLESG